MIHIPFLLKVRIILSKMFWILACFIAAMAFLLNYVTEKDWYALRMLDENSPIVEGRIVDKWEEKYSYNEETGEEKFTFGYQYMFTAPTGEQIYWTSYSKDTALKVGAPLAIRYSAEEPKINQAVGMTNEVQSPEINFIFAAILLIIGLALNWFSGGGRFKLIPILNRGALTMARYARKEATSTSVNDNTVYKLFYQFTTESGEEIEATVRTHNYKKLTDQKNELVLYRPDKPNKIVVVDSLPKSARKFLYKEYERISGKKLRRKVI